MKIQLSTLAVVLFFSGCVSNNGPTVDLLMHGKTSDAKVTYNFSKIGTDQKLYIDDITMSSLYLKTAENLEYDSELEPKDSSMRLRDICAPGEDVVSVLGDEGYHIVSDKKDADYIITLENLGCGRYGKIKQHIRSPLASKASNDIDTKNVQDASSYANSAAALSSSGANSNMSGAMVGLSILSLFSGDKTNYFFSAVHISVANKKTGIAENALYYTFASNSKGILGFAKNVNKHIANRLEMEID